MTYPVGLNFSIDLLKGAEITILGNFDASYLVIEICYKPEIFTRAGDSKDVSTMKLSALYHIRPLKRSFGKLNF
jgi:hypothetical protein